MVIWGCLSNPSSCLWKVEQRQSNRTAWKMCGQALHRTIFSHSLYINGHFRDPLWEALTLLEGHTLQRKESCAESHCLLGITLPMGLTRPQANIPQNNANKPNDSWGVHNVSQLRGSEHWLQRKYINYLSVNPFPWSCRLHLLRVTKEEPLI